MSKLTLSVIIIFITLALGALLISRVLPVTTEKQNAIDTILKEQQQPQQSE